ncbi:hypothetical protein C8Q75DRAFT_760087 [Abortiporus biennis]|nr:hypothetical protein C8Q75DRAFT_760087 [Abortiporus biennis]
MDTPLAIPRLRLTRHSPRLRPSNSDLLDTPVAGPSRISLESDEEDTEATPRISSNTNLVSSERNSPMSNTTSASPTDPASRLRALLARTSISSSPGPSSHTALPTTPSDRESDFDIPNFSTGTRSIARENLKELISYALREPGDTPREGKQRQNSIDTSEVEATPRIEQAEYERATFNGKRRSMSDEESEKSRILADVNVERPLRSSAAAYDALRQRLAQVDSMPPTRPPKQPSPDTSIVMEEKSTEEYIVVPQQLDNSTAAPEVSSTPMRSMQLPSNIQMQSNLLEQDSEMQRAMNGMDSYDDDSVSQKRFSFPSARPANGHPSSPRPLSWSSHSKSHSIHNLPLVRRGSEEIESSSSRGSSVLSSSDYSDRKQEVQRERLHDRERGWNSPQHPKSAPAGTPEHKRHHHSHSSPSHSTTIGGGRGSPAPVRGLSRQSSAASLRSVDDGRSSRASSVSSRSEYHERMKEAEEERNKEREKLWNQPAHSRLRSSSTLSFHSPPDRTRTYSQPVRPDSAQSFLTPDRSLRRQKSINSLSGSSRPVSPASSIASFDFEKDEEKEVVKEVEHIRERNWNSPHPKWEAPNLHHRRSISPLPQSPKSPLAPSFSTKLNGKPSSPSSHRESFVKEKTSSLSRSSSLKEQSLDKSGRQSLSRSSSLKEISLSKSTSVAETSSLLADKTPSSGPKMPSSRTNGHTKLPRPSSPAPASISAPKAGSSTPAYSSKFGWAFPRNRKPVTSDLESDRDEHLASPPSRSSSRASHASHIPVRSPKKSESTAAGMANDDVAAARKKGHRRSFTEFTESATPNPPIIKVDSIVLPDLSQEDMIHESDQDSQDSPGTSVTPLAKPAPLPEVDEPLPPPITITSSSPQQPPIDAMDHIPEIPDSPPSSPYKSLNDPSSLFLQTPPRKMQSFKLEFKTPSPPKNMPDLPGPPPSSSEDEEDDDRTPVNVNNTALGNLTAMKTPKPPGAWFATPAAMDKELIRRPSSTPPENSISPLNRGLVTPGSISRSDSLPIQTPAPPGAWFNTPGSLRRKNPLKVRFDVENMSVSSDGGLAEIPIVGPSDHSDADMSMSLDTTEDIVQPPSPPRSSPPSNIKSVAPPSTPPSKPLRTPKSPSVRILDAFGRETVEPEPQPEISPKIEEGSFQIPQIRETSTPKNKSAIRIVDAMGREVNEEKDHPVKIEALIKAEMTDDFEAPLSHNEALARVKETIAHLAEDLDEVDKSCDDLAHDVNRLAALEDVSKAARKARQKLNESLKMVSNAEDDLRSKLGAMREGMNRSKLLPPISQRVYTWNFMNAWTLWIFLAIQVVLLALMYRYSAVRAKKIFLSTYFDAFNADIYLHLTKPDTSSNSIPRSFSWSIFSIPDAISRLGWQGVASEIWGNVTCLFTDFQRQAWETWGPQGQLPLSGDWPPT